MGARPPQPGARFDDRCASPAREWAMRNIARLAQRYPDVPIGMDEPADLDARDAALAHHLVETTLRRWITLAYTLDWALDGRWDRLEPKMQAALLVGAAQILFFDRVPRRAAVDESVRWVKRALRIGAGGLANASLRRLSFAVDLERREKCLQGRDEIPLADGRASGLCDGLELPVDPLERISIACSVPIDLLRRWTRAIGMERARALALHGIIEPPVVLNTAHAKAPLPEGALQQHDSPGSCVFHGSKMGLHALLAKRTDIWAQDAGSSMPVTLAAGLAPSLIAGVCAGRGTKTRQLRAIFPEAQIVATDINPSRREALAEVFAHDHHVRVFAHDALCEFAGKVDLALIDAPCSNTAVLARRVEARYRATDETIESLAQTQRQILADSVRLLAPGGAMLYATCSLDERENEAQAKWLQRWHSLEPRAEQLLVPAGLPGDPATRYSDGAYAVLLA